MSYIAVIISSILLISSCGSSEESKENQSTSTADSIERPENMSDVKADTIPTPEPPGPGLAPGQAEVEVKVLKFIDDKGNGSNFLQLRIRKVLGYGQSTPSLAVDDTLEVTVGEEKDNIEIGQGIRMILQQNIASVESTPASAWSLVKIKK